MNKVYLDIGFHRGQGLEEFTKKLFITRDWTVHTWEPNPTNHKHQRKKVADWAGKAYEPIHHHEAVMDFNGSITLYQESNNGAKDGWGSTCIEESSHGNLNTHVQVGCVDLYEWLIVHTSPYDEVYIKMDIEGAEFRVLRHMLECSSGLRKSDPCYIWGRIKGMWVEYHERYIPGETRETREKLHQQLRQLTDANLHW